LIYKKDRQLIVMRKKRGPHKHSMHIKSLLRKL